MTSKHLTRFGRLMTRSRIALFSLVLLSAWSSRANAAEVERAVTRAAVDAYVKEQLKFQLAEFLNHHPHVVMSTNPQIGTQGLNFVSRALATYGLLTARTDRERVWSAAHLLVSPEPVTAAILIGAQVVESLLEMQSAVSLAAIHKEIVELQARTFAIHASLLTQDLDRNRRVIVAYNEAMDTIESVRVRLADHPVYRLLVADGDIEVAPRPEDIEGALRLLLELSHGLDTLEEATLRMEFAFDPDFLGLPSTFASECMRINAQFDPLRGQLWELRSALVYFFASSNAADLKSRVQSDFGPLATRARIYRRCVEMINSLATEIFWTRREVEFDEKEMTDQCQARFALKGVDR